MILSAVCRSKAAPDPWGTSFPIAITLLRGPLMPKLDIHDSKRAECWPCVLLNITTFMLEVLRIPSCCSDFAKTIPGLP